MQTRSLAALSLICVVLPGCAALSGRASDAAMRDPALLLELANQAVDEDDPELAYRYLGTIHALHPASPQNREAFPRAAVLFRHNYLKHRMEFDSAWVASEPRFMISWLAGLYEDGAGFPQENVDKLLVGMDGGLFRQFQTYAQNHPKLYRWRITATDDNGIVQKIEATQIDAPHG